MMTVLPENATHPMQKAMQRAVLMRKSMNDVWRAALAELPAEEACDAEPGTTLRDAVLTLNHLWNTSNNEATIADQLDLCRRLAKYTPQADPDLEPDAVRFRWLIEDHSDPETRAKCRELLGRMGVMGQGAARADIDSAMAADIKRSMLRTVDAHVAACKEA